MAKAKVKRKGKAATDLEIEVEVEYVDFDEKVVHRGDGQVKVKLGKRFERVQAGGLDFMQEVWDELESEPVEGSFPAPVEPAETESEDGKG